MAVKVSRADWSRLTEEQQTEIERIIGMFHGQTVEADTETPSILPGAESNDRLSCLATCAQVCAAAQAAANALPWPASTIASAAAAAAFGICNAAC